MFYCLFYLLEITVGFVYGLAIGKGVVIFLKNILEIDYLMAVYNADKESFFLVVVRAYHLYPRRSVLENGEDILRYLVGVSCYDRELTSLFRSRNYIISYVGRDKAIEDTQADGLIVV